MRRRLRLSKLPSAVVLGLLLLSATSHGFIEGRWTPPKALCKREEPNRSVQILLLSLSSSLSSSSSSSSEAPVKRGAPVSDAASQRGSSFSSKARYLAVKALLPSSRRTRQQGSTAFAVDRLESNVHYANTLTQRDRAFCRLLVTTAERRLGQIDAVLGACQRKQSSEQRRSRVDQFVEAVLRIGAAQLLFLGVSPHAAVKETVDVLRMDKEIHVPEPKIKFVNAVLRRLAGEGPELLAATDVTDNAAPWLVEEWRQQWGEAVTRNILEAAMKESPRCLTVNLNWRGPAEDGSRRTAMQRIEYVASQFPRSEILPQGSIRVLKPPPGPISTWPLYQEGAWWCQDVSATLPGMALYQGVSCQGQLSVDDVHVIDLCAAPGGKAAHLSNYGFASVTAVELSSRRCVRLKQNMQRLGQNWNIVVADGCEWTPRESVGAVLLDVPCTATGTASKRPDVLRRSPDYAELLDVQYRLACHAADEVLQVGGILVYATCSLLKQESEDQVTKLLSRPTGATLRTVSFGPGEIPGFDDAIDANGWIRVLPGSLPGSLSQCDGFFVARLERIR